VLTCQLLKNHAGIVLVGDYTTLRSLHEVVHEVNEKSPLIKDKEGFFLALAYDVRKAYEAEREIIDPLLILDQGGFLIHFVNDLMQGTQRCVIPDEHYARMVFQKLAGQHVVISPS
jgi:hypothetical protein